MLADEVNQIYLFGKLLLTVLLEACYACFDIIGLLDGC